MPHVESDIEVNAPVDRVYQMWTNYERFPEFMEHVKEVRRTSGDMTHWVAEVAGKRMEWDARTMTEDQRRVAWTASGESGQSGEVLFEPVGAGKTRVKAKIDYKLDSRLQEAVANTFKIDNKAVKDDLQNFKTLIEGQGGNVGGTTGGVGGTRGGTTGGTMGTTGGNVGGTTDRRL